MTSVGFYAPEVNTLQSKAIVIIKDCKRKDS